MALQFHRLWIINTVDDFSLFMDKVGTLKGKFEKNLISLLPSE